MRHLTEEELIEHYYGESSTNSGAAIHLELCGRCARSYETLRKDLEGIEFAPAPQPTAEFGDRIWEEIRNSLPVYEKQPSFWARLWNWKNLSYALACSTLILAAFIGGRYWEQHQNKTLTASTSAPNRQRVVLLVVGDHLDRSERLLVELNHAKGTDPQLTQPIQNEARRLLTDNRLYLQSSTVSADPLLAGALDHLERVLLEVANDPNGLSREDIARLQEDMNTKGLLFEIRVLKTRTAQETGDAKVIKKGLAI